MEIETVCNTSDDVLFDHIKTNSKLDIPWLKQEEEHEWQAVIVGGGPSLVEWLDEIRFRKSQGQIIFALNGAAKYLESKGIRADYTVIVDARKHNEAFMGYSNEYLLSSQCNPDLFKYDGVTLWHQEYPEDMERFDSCLPDNYPEHTLVGGGTTVGLSAMAIAYILGYRKLHLYGFDSSYRTTGHAYEQTDPQLFECTATVAGKTFKTTLAMAKQAELVPEICDTLIDLGCLITLRGDGLLPWTSQQSAIKQEFDSEADKYREMWKHDAYRTTAPGELVIDLFMDWANPKGEVYDFGCGTGRAMLEMVKYGLNPLGIDFTDNSRDEEARKLPFLQWDITKRTPLKHIQYGYCTDVLEHIEPENVDSVLDTIAWACSSCFFQISTVPDHMGALIGHPLHLTVQSPDWWTDKLKSKGWVIKQTQSDDISVCFYATRPLWESNKSG